jgi:small multidrug resistance family-3 protein
MASDTPRLSDVDLHGEKINLSYVALGLWWIAAGVLALGAYGFVATFQPSVHFGRILAAYGGVFVAGSLAWGVIVDGFRPDRWDLIGATICLVGVAVIM